MDALLSLYEKYEPTVISWGLKLLTALLILIIGRWIARLLGRITERLLTSRLKADAALGQFVGTIVAITLTVVALVTALQQLGIPIASLLAVLGAAGLAVGLALKDSLTNFASGVMLMVTRPFRAGDFVEAAGTSGVVERVGIFNTVLCTVTGQEVTVPNSNITANNIVNYSIRPGRRIDYVFGIAYEDDIPKARQIIQEVIAADERLHKDPAPIIWMDALADSSVNLAVKVWTDTAVYWDVRSDLIERVKTEFDRAGITIPFPQRTVHHVNAPGAGAAHD